MSSRVPLCVTLITVLFMASIKAEEYDYLEQARWYDSYKECGMQSQSPIELNSNEAQVLRDMPAISFTHYNIPFILPAKCENNGHTINIQLPKPKVYLRGLQQIFDKLSPHITGGPFPATARYIAESVHFHWGSKDSHGSEHVINSQRFAMEMHILHRNTIYNTVEEAREHADGLAVIAVLFEVKSNLDTDFTGLNNVVAALEKIAKTNASSEISNFTLADLFSVLDTAEFFTYAGSLTTPPCSQAVTWLIFSHTINLSHAQMARFHYISDAHNSIMENNYRSLQAKGNRKVYLRKVLEESTTKANTQDTEKHALVPESDILLFVNIFEKILKSSL